MAGTKGRAKVVVFKTGATAGTNAEGGVEFKAEAKVEVEAKVVVAKTGTIAGTGTEGGTKVKVEEEVDAKIEDRAETEGTTT